jgi:peptidylamidoglycolate lyase
VSFDIISNQFIVVDDATTFFNLKHKGSDIILFDAAGNPLTRFGRSGSYDGPKCWYHAVTTDKAGNIYTGDILGNTIQKFKRISKE